MALKFTNSIDDGDYAPSVKYGTTIRQPVSMEINTPDVNSSFNIDLSSVANAIADRTQSEERMKLAEIEADLKIAEQKKKDEEDITKEIKRQQGLKYLQGLKDIEARMEQGASLNEVNVLHKQFRDNFISSGTLLSASDITALDSSVSIGALKTNEKKKQMEYTFEQDNATMKALGMDRNGRSYAENLQTLRSMRSINEARKNANTSVMNSSGVVNESTSKALKESQNALDKQIISDVYTNALSDAIKTGDTSIYSKDSAYKLKENIKQRVLSAYPDIDPSLLDTYIDYTAMTTGYTAAVNAYTTNLEDSKKQLETIQSIDDLKMSKFMRTAAPLTAYLENMPAEVRESMLQDNYLRQYLQGEARALAGLTNYDDAQNPKPGDVTYEGYSSPYYTGPITLGDNVTSFNSAGYDATKQRIERIGINMQEAISDINNPRCTDGAACQSLNNATRGFIYGPEYDGKINDAKKTEQLLKSSAVQARTENNAKNKEQVDKLAKITRGYTNAYFASSSGMRNQEINKRAAFLNDKMGDYIYYDDKNGKLAVIPVPGVFDNISDEATEMYNMLEIIQSTNYINEQLQKMPTPYDKEAFLEYIFNRDLPKLEADADVLSYGNLYKHPDAALLMGLSLVSKAGLKGINYSFSGLSDYAGTKYKEITGESLKDTWIRYASEWYDNNVGETTTDKVKPYVAKKSEPYLNSKGILTIPISDDNTLEIRNYNGDDYSNITDVNNLYIDTVDEGFIILERGDSQHSYGIYPTKEDAELALAITKEQVSINE